MRLAVLVVLVVAATALAQAPARTPAILAAGKAAYEGSAAGCHACHGVTGEGNGPVGFFLDPRPRNFTKDPFKGGETVEQVFATITSGLPNTSMTKYAHLAEDTRWALAYYVLSFRPRK
jgi:cytochrome c553